MIQSIGPPQKEGDSGSTPSRDKHPQREKKEGEPGSLYVNWIKRSKQNYPDGKKTKHTMSW